MKRTATLILVLCSTLIVFAQSKSKITIGLSVNPFYTGSINTSSSNDVMGSSNITYSKYNDSIGATEGLRLSFGITAWVNYMLNSDWTVQAGVGYMDVGFQRVQKDLKYLDYMYPGMGSGLNGGRVVDRTNSVKNVEYNYRYQYLHIPVIFNYNIRNRRDLFVTFALSAGASLNVLVDHRLTANLINFSVEGETSYSFDSTGYRANRFGANFFLGGRMDYRFDKQLSFMLQPFFAISPFSVSSTAISVYPYWFGANVGVAYHLKTE